MIRLPHVFLLCVLFACSSDPESPEQPVSVGSSEPVASDPVEIPPSTSGPVYDPNRDPNETPIDVAAPPAYAETTPSGLASHMLRPGDGVNYPRATSRVQVHYAGWTTDGALFDSSYERGRPATFPLNGVIAGWTEGVQLMSVGEVRRFWIPAELAYGNNAGGGRPSGLLVFDVELLAIP
ncbi:MAG: FKBP-type peptidyl-prolyl cis-trans isomerase [Myxococcota bacterium]